MSCCRLCLQRFTGPAVSLLETNTSSGDQHGTDLATKIRTCLGVFLDPSSPEEALCGNCHQTVLFVDDFRTMCLQTSEIFGMISVEEEAADKRTSYQMYVEELRRMVQEQRITVQELVDAGVNAVKVKLEPGPEAHDSEEESLMEDQFGGPGQLQKESFVISTIEMVKGEPVEEDSMVVEVPKVEQPGCSDEVADDDDTFPLDLKLAIANEMLNHPELWNTTNESCTETQEQTWNEIALALSLDISAVQEYWLRLQLMFQEHLKTDHQTASTMSPKLAHVMSMLETMLKANEPSECGFDPENAEMRRRLADEILRRSIIWDDTHPDFDKVRRRSEAWEATALALGSNRAVVRTPWQSVLNEARRNPETDASRLVDPLYRLLHETLAERLRPSSRWPPRHAQQKKQLRPVEVADEQLQRSPYYVPPLPQRAQRPLGSIEIRNRLAEELLKHEVIWNDKHPDYRSSAKRSVTFQKIASRLQVDWKVIRREWGWVLSMSRKSREENGGQVEEKLIAKDPLQKLLNITVAERLGALPRRRKKPNPKREDKVETKKAVVSNFCELCNKHIPRAKFDDHMNTHNGLTPYECKREGCGKRFPTKEHFRKHETNVHADTRFECSECDRKFAKKCKLELHFALQHKSHDLPCTICGKLLKHRSSLLIHMRRHEIKYPCSFCDAQLSTKHALAEHERIHTKERPFECEQCSERFRTNTAKRLHVYKMHFVPVKS